MSRVSIFALLLILCSAVGAAPPAEAPTEGLLEVSVIRDLSYVPGVDDDDRRKLDLYVPEGEGPWPTLLWIHGGAWAVGHRKNEEALARRFAERGIAVASADHRMSKALWIDEKLDTGIQHPEHVKDCAAAFAWLVGQAEARGLDPDRLFVGGFSSGAHLSALLATDPRYLKAHDLEASRIRGALPVAGGYDLVAYYESHRKANGEEFAERHVLDVFGREEGVLADASPTTHLKETTVPMLVLAEKDTRGYTELFEKAVAEAEITRIRFLYFDERSHRDLGAHLARETPDPARDAMIAFIRETPK